MEVEAIRNGPPHQQASRAKIIQTEALQDAPKELHIENLSLNENGSSAASSIEPHLEGIPLAEESDVELDNARLAARIARRPTKVELKLRNILKTNSLESMTPEHLVAEPQPVMTFAQRREDLKSCLRRRPSAVILESQNILKNPTSPSISSPREQFSEMLEEHIQNRPSPQTVRRKLNFHESVEVMQTFRLQEYNRRPDQNSTFRKLTPKLKMEIRAELNSYKKTEMAIHAASVKNTAFH